MKHETSKILTSAIIRYVQSHGGQSYSLVAPAGRYKLQRKHGMPMLKIIYRGRELFVEVRARIGCKSAASGDGQNFLAHSFAGFQKWFDSIK